MSLSNLSLDTIVKYARRKGFVYPGSEIYGGLANTWDFGPKGVLLKENLKKLWKLKFVYQRQDMVELDSGILAHQKIWEASGHTASFADCLVDCKECKSRLRADHLIEDAIDVDVEGKTTEEITKIIQENKIKCPKCSSFNWTNARYMNLMFETNRDKLSNSITILEELLAKKEGDSISLNAEDVADLQQKLESQMENRVYLRPETCQPIFVQFKNILQTERPKFPFGIAQIGKAFRNEITPGNFIFRTIEFEAMEIEYFIREEDWKPKFEEWLKEEQDFLVNYLGFNEDNFKLFDHPTEKLSHYSKRTVDILYNFPFGFKELWGLAYRTNFDLNQHQKYSEQDLQYTDPQTGEKFTPHVIEPALGVDRLFLASLCEHYDEEELTDSKGEKDLRIVVRFPFDLAPYKIAVLPLMKKDGMGDKAQEIFADLRKAGIMADFDDAGSIGKRYRRQDENGTPWCVTVDYETLDKDHADFGTITLRHRDSMTQTRIKIEEIQNYLNKVKFGK